jgi:hypothetical protein
MRKLLINFFLLFFWIAQAQTYNYYFGNLHAHTAFSDGNKDSLVSGIGRPDGSYAYAKLSNDFDFLGISEHNHYNSPRSPGFRRSLYQAGLNMANAANQEGVFLSLFGMEYGISSGNNGHVVIYGFNQLIGWESNVGGISGNNYDIYNAKSDYEGLFKKIKNNPAAFAYLAHPYWTDFSKNGNDSSALAFSAYNAMYDSAIVGVPLRSGNAFSTFVNYNDYSTGDYFNYYKKLLNIGYHLGIGYDHDNHYSNFGRSNGGRLVVIAPSLTRANLFDAMQQMHFYGSDDNNAKVQFTMNEKIMGSILSGKDYPSFNIIHNDPDAEQADTIRLWRGYKNSGGLWAQVIQTSLNTNTAAFTDQSILGGIEYYYFVDIKQADGQWIVTSPIWYTFLSTVAVNESEKKQINVCYFPNPVSGLLNMSLTESGTYQVQILDLQGRLIFENMFSDKDITLNISEFSKGIYILKVSKGEFSVSKKLVVE